MTERFLTTFSHWEMTWISGARPPVHPEPMRGRGSFKSMDAALTRFSEFADDAILESLTLVITERKDFTADALDRIKRRKQEVKP